MSQSTQAPGTGRRVLYTVIALVVGLGAAGAATAAVVDSFSPDDSAARNTGPTEPVSPGQLLGYGD
ncbi:hypothetical protein MWU75_08840 [Ornithinimicrobium sp. F0845]|uniref:hypothetical protein n=1 Tax=Ornithinimicrobium sp. F0845 TaxID=2926412 RepID=UPI001FF69B25|nr:hypothetical protein [Ornithinimicrobium sp. F0845]MCK0112241.1 hypothetical protein [Ornithinimicrobium sp. F0845]